MMDGAGEEEWAIVVEQPVAILDFQFASDGNLVVWTTDGEPFGASREPHVVVLDADDGAVRWIRALPEGIGFHVPGDTVAFTSVDPLEVELVDIADGTPVFSASIDGQEGEPYGVQANPLPGGDVLVTATFIVENEGAADPEDEIVHEERAFLLSGSDGAVLGGVTRPCGFIGADATSYYCAEPALARYPLPTEIAEL